MRMLACLLILWSAAAGARPFEGLSRRDQVALLYRPQLQFGQGGEPLVAVGLDWGIERASFMGPRGLRLLPAGLDGVEIPVVPGERVTVRIASAQPARVRYWAAVRHKGHDARRAASLLATWSKRGFKPRLFDIGGVVGLRDRVLDNRIMVIGLEDVGAPGEATRLAQRIARRWKVRTSVHAEMRQPPRGVLEVVGREGAVRARVRDLLWIVATEGDEVQFGKRSYRGTVYATLDAKGKLVVANTLPVEEMLLGVVPAEIYPSAPMEALKAQAVTARGEVLAKLGTRHFTEPFQIGNRQHCQVYRGRSREHRRTSRAVRLTRGKVLWSARGLVDTVYSANCGGHTEHNQVVWGSGANPTLRGRPDGGRSPGDLSRERNLRRFLRRRPATYCSPARQRRSRRFRWTRTFSQKELAALVARKRDVGRILSVEALGRGVSGRVKAVRFHGDRGDLTVKREYPVRKLLGGLYSGMFVVDTEPGDGAPSQFVFRGGGWGHGVGMCQTGAMGMAKAGKSYKAILRHYYRGSRIRQVY